MEELINKQLALKELLEKCVINYKKDGKDKRTQSYYQRRLQNFENLWNEFNDRHKSILELKYSIKDFDATKYEYLSKDIFSEMDEFFDINYTLIQQRFEKEYPKVEPENPGQSENKIVRESNSSVKLPKIYLEKFSGDYRKWPTFHDLFRTLVHENKSLSPVQKLQYLKRHLSGQPEQLLRHFQITDGNYIAAWDLLKDRYDNKRILVNTHLKILLSQTILSNESAQGIKTFLDTTTECLQALVNLGINVENWDPLIVYFIAQRLPSETHQLWEQSISTKKEVPSWKQLQEFLESRFRTLEAVFSKKNGGNRDLRNVFQGAKTNTKSFHVSANVSCSICLANHSIRQCPTFISYNPIKRMEVVKVKGLCINCLGSGHILANCPSQQKCWHCKQRHHSLLHRKPNESLESANVHNNKNSSQNVNANYGSYEFTKNSDRSPSTVQQASSSQPLSTGASVFTPNKAPSTSEAVSSFLVSKAYTQQVLLATALVRVVSPTGQEQIVRALIDQGSQASFLTESVVQNLKLKRESNNANVQGLGKESINKIHHMVSFTIKPLKTDFSIEVTGLVLKN